MITHIIWLDYQLSITGFLLGILIIVISNIRLLKSLSQYPEPSSFPKVSILVPARNEESNIEDCLSSLLAQDYPDFQVIVLDDNSTDSTWEILTRIAEGNKRLNIIKGKPLPPGWLGKHWACSQLAQNADGDLLLFTDADTRHHPRTLREAVAALFAEKADIITAFPYEEVVTWSERLMVPLFPWFILGFLPLFLAYRLKSSALSAGIGQFMFFRREAYYQIGGYEAIKQEVVDDVALVKKIKKAGLKWRMANGNSRIRCRMYHGFHDVYQGFTKNLFAGFGYSILKFLLVWLWIGIIFLQPIVIIIMKLAGVSFSSLSVILSVISIIISLTIWGLSNWRFKFPIYLTFLYPINVILAILIAMSSMGFALTGKAKWKERTFEKQKIKLW